MIPDFDPAAQEDIRQAEWDRKMELLKRCFICKELLYPGVRFHTACGCTLCTSCVEELNNNEDIVEFE